MSGPMCPFCNMPLYRLTRPDGWADYKWGCNDCSRDFDRTQVMKNIYDGAMLWIRKKLSTNGLRVLVKNELKRLE